jgi:hypothetical protein
MICGAWDSLQDTPLSNWNSMPEDRFRVNIKDDFPGGGGFPKRKYCERGAGYHIP